MDISKHEPHIRPDHAGPEHTRGRASIRGLRISVAHVVSLVANGMTPAQIVADLPDLEDEDVRQALAVRSSIGSGRSPSDSRLKPMRFLADAGISPKTVDFLKHLGHEVAHVRALGLERAADSDLVARAREDSSVVVTFDLDFGDILALGVLDRPSVIICRLSDERAESVNRRLATVLGERLGELESGALILVEDTRYRVRKLPIGRP